MQTGKFNIIIDSSHGSSGKGKSSTWLADYNNITHVSSSNFPNAGHCQTAETIIITENGLEKLGDVVRRKNRSRVINMEGYFEEVTDYVLDGIRKTNLIKLKNG